MFSWADWLIVPLKTTIFIFLENKPLALIHLIVDLVKDAQSTAKNVKIILLCLLLLLVLFRRMQTIQHVLSRTKTGQAYLVY